MTDYRVYFLDTEDHIFAAEEMTATDDDEIIAGADDLCRRHLERCAAIEIWDRERKVHRQSAQAAA